MTTFESLPFGALPPAVVSRSAHALKSFQQCAKQFELKYVRRLNWPQSTRHFDFGLQVHQLMDYQAKGVDVASFLATQSHAQSSRFAEVTAVYNALCSSTWGQAPVVASEWPFQVRLGETLLEGRIDRVIQEPASGHYIILDWKTGTATPRFPETDWQTLLYLYAASKTSMALTGKAFEARNWSMAYVEVNRQTLAIKETRVPASRVFDLEHNTLATVEDALLSLLERLDVYRDATVFPLPPACPDKYCPYSAVCGILETPPNEAVHPA